MNKMTPPLVLIILDGWGLAPAGPGNAITQASTPNFDRFWHVYPHTQLEASGEAVGLPKNEDGNSETGHLNLGAGTIVLQDLPRINSSIANKSFFQKEAFQAAVRHVRQHRSRLHLLGLIGAGGVHSSLSHLLALLGLAKNEKISPVFLHFFTDGRDSPPKSAAAYLKQVETKINQLGVGKIATLIGRYFAMDRDNRWDRTKKAYHLLTLGSGQQVTSTAEALASSYQAGKTDEFLEPVVLNPTGLIENNDAVIFFNFRIDRPRQLTKAFVLPNFESLKPPKASFDPYAELYGLRLYQLPQKATTTFRRQKILKNLFFATMTEYEKNLPVQVAFSPVQVKIPLGRVLAERGLRQYHLAETEKFPHVTVFFNGGREQPFSGEDQVEVASPDVTTYDQKPAMSAQKLTNLCLKQLKSGTYDFLLLNFANPDMVGHTGNLPAAIKACEVTDACLGQIVKTVITLGGHCLVTADHGNVEEMIEPTSGEMDTKHSTNPVPLIIISPQFNHQGRTLPRGILADVAPTILDLFKIEKPDLMTGQNLTTR